MIAICTDNQREALASLGDRVASFRLSESRGTLADGSDFIIALLDEYDVVNRYIGLELKGLEVVGSPNKQAVERLRVQVRL